MATQELQSTKRLSLEKGDYSVSFDIFSNDTAAIAEFWMYDIQRTRSMPLAQARQEWMRFKREGYLPKNGVTFPPAPLPKTETPWTVNEETGTFSIEMSTLYGNDLFLTFSSRAATVIGPERENIPFSRFTRIFDSEGEVTHWAYQAATGTYIIFND